MYQSPIAVPAGAAPVVLTPQDRPRWSRPAQLLSSVLSLLVVAVVIYELRGVDLRGLAALVPFSPAFWLVFAVRYLASPACDWLIFRRLWSVGRSAFGALLRKLIYNELLLGYVGEAYFYTWARRKLTLEAAPFGAVKDVAILSALAGNIVTLVLLAVAWPLASVDQLGLGSRALLLSLGVVLLTSLAAMLLRRQIFTLPRPRLRFIFAMHVGRIVATTFLSALLWHLALPLVPLGLWLLLSAVRLLISRLPLVPNKDIIFAGVAVFMLGHDVEVASLMTLMAGLILATHLVIGSGLALFDLSRRTSAT